MRRSLILGLVLSLLLSVLTLPISARADAPVTVLLNGQVVTFEVAPMIVEDRTYVPVRFVLERIQAEVDWDGVKRQVSVRQGAKTVLLTVGQRQIQVDGQVKETDVAAFIHMDRTMVPLRLLAEAFGFEVGWDGASRTVQLRSPAAPITIQGSVTAGQLTGVKVGDTVILPVRIAGVTDVKAVGIRLSYDPSKLTALQVRQGQVLSEISLKQDFDNQAGTVEYVGASAGDKPFSGDGLLFEVVFRAAATGAVTVQLSSADPSGALWGPARGYSNPAFGSGSVIIE